MKKSKRLPCRHDSLPARYGCYSSESCDEKRVVHRIKEEMEKSASDKVEIDPMGNVLGYIGHGPRLVAMDAHIDTVGIGKHQNWDFLIRMKAWKPTS